MRRCRAKSRRNAAREMSQCALCPEKSVPVGATKLEQRSGLNPQSHANWIMVGAIHAADHTALMRQSSIKNMIECEAKRLPAVIVLERQIA